MQEEKCLKVCTHVHVIIENNFTSRCLNLVSSAQTALIPNICESHSQDGLARVPKTYIWVRRWGGRQYFTPFFYSYFFYSIFFSKQTNITKKATWEHNPQVFRQPHICPAFGRAPPDSSMLLSLLESQPLQLRQNRLLLHFKRGLATTFVPATIFTIR